MYRRETRGGGLDKELLSTDIQRLSIINTVLRRTNIFLQRLEKSNCYHVRVSSSTALILSC